MAIILCALARNNKGATAIEYGLIVALIAVACIGAFGTFGNKLGSQWNNISTVVLSH
jgi:pilus assembly protein Flp/PilA